MGEPQFQHGVVTILDALGASSYGNDEVRQFLRARENVLVSLAEVRESFESIIDESNLSTFTFNDTIVLVLRTGGTPPTLKQIAAFSGIVRRFLVDSLANNLFFRGSAAIGMFHVDEGSNTVMGDAITDAAQWYEESDWIGVHFTPKSCLLIEAKMEMHEDKKAWALARYPVPLHHGKILDSFAINWPKVLLTPKLNPWKSAGAPRAVLLKCLSRNKVPKGTEDKYRNTMAFYDHSAKAEAGRRSG